jgi:hypothetical protein
MGPDISDLWWQMYIELLNTEESLCTQQPKVGTGWKSGWVLPT